MKYKTIPNTNIQIPAYMPTPASMLAIDKALLAKNAKAARYLKRKWFGGTK